MTRPAVADVFAARGRIRDRIRATPLVRSTWLSGVTGADVWLQLESLQVTHSFKVRGALNAVRRLDTHAADHTRVVTASAGNHGVALAWAAQGTTHEVTVFTPANAPATKLDAIRQFGATLVSEGDTYDVAERAALKEAAASGARYVSPYNDPDVVAGAGTIALEVLDQLPDVNTIVVPVGGGGLISGTAITAAALSPSTRVVGVEAAVNPAFRLALEHGGVTTFDVSPTIADGLGGNLQRDTITFPIVRDLVSALLAVSEEELHATMRGLAEREHLIVEGAGAAAVAALLARAHDVRPGERVVAFVTGANIDIARLRGILA